MNQSTPPYPASQTLLPGCATRPHFMAVSPGFGLFRATSRERGVKSAVEGSLQADEVAPCVPFLLMEDHPAKRRRIEEPAEAAQATVAQTREAGQPSSRYVGVRAVGGAGFCCPAAPQLPRAAPRCPICPNGYPRYSEGVRPGAAGQP